MNRNRCELAVMECVDSGKPNRDFVQVDLSEVINAIKWHAGAVDKIDDQSTH